MKVFKEEQRFTQTWIIVITIFSMVVPITLITKKYLNAFSGMTTYTFIFTTALVVACGCLMFLFKLTTRIDEIGIHYQFFPFHFSMKTIKWLEIKSVYIKKYDAINDYGGWGLKNGLFWKTGKGKSITVSGDIGIQLILKNKSKILIGTLKEFQINSVLQTYFNATKND